MTKKRIVILGSTGSIGESALKVVEQLHDRLEVAGLAARRSTGRLFEQAARFGARTVAVADPASAAEAAARVPAGMKMLSGPEGVEELAAMDGADIVLAATVGMSGLKPVLAALGRGRDVALATKEVLVAAGELVIGESARTGARLI
ncbi:MAG: 1-deoxy-D-xylulose-5-phosphate reductoisomerase, partial [Lentisphaerae bacterium]|nr:1-deoxy-D-xylulose-5-phosphate reductoisomerase [Lentisphaerota bacterium]